MTIILIVSAIVMTAAFVGFIHASNSLKPEDIRILEDEAQISYLSSVRKKITV